MGELSEEERRAAKLAKMMGGKDELRHEEVYQFDTPATTKPTGIYKSLAKTVGKHILDGRPEVGDGLLESNLKGQNCESTRVNIEHSDGSKIEIDLVQSTESETKSDKVIVFFPAQAANYKSKDMVDRMADVSRRTGCTVVGFNFRDNPLTEDDHINDGRAVVDYLKQKHDLKSQDVLICGESYGAGIGMHVVAENKGNKGEDDAGMRIFTCRSFSKLAKAGKSLVGGRAYDSMSKTAAKLSPRKLGREGKSPSGEAKPKSGGHFFEKDALECRR